MNECIWKRQPESPDEMERAFAAFSACCVGCYRYAGNDPKVVSRVGVSYCDHPSLRDRIRERARQRDVAQRR